jgi:hypothetical protein
MIGEVTVALCRGMPRGYYLAYRLCEVSAHEISSDRPDLSPFGFSVFRPPSTFPFGFPAFREWTSSQIGKINVIINMQELWNFRTGADF